MIRLECFSRKLGQQLLDRGYSHFVIKYRADEDDDEAYCNVVTLEATKGQFGKNAVLIKHIMELPADATIKYYVMLISDEVPRMYD